MNKPLTTGWADWQLIVDKTMPHAEQWMDFNPAKSEATAMAPKDLPDGVRVRLEQRGETFEQWVPAGWQITVPDFADGNANRLRLETNSAADRARAARFRSETQRRQRQPGRIQKHVARFHRGRRQRDRSMLDEQSIQFSGRMVAHLDRTDLQNFAGVVEPGKSRIKAPCKFCAIRAGR